MLPLRSYQPLELPSFDDLSLKALSAKGYAWAVGEIEGVPFRWLSPTSWTRVANLPPGEDRDFAPAMAFVHEPSGAVAGLRYACAAWSFDPGDMLDVADPRPFQNAVAYTLDGTLVAERLGRANGKLLAAAAHRRGPHVFVVACEAPDAPELLEAVRAFGSGIRIKADAPEPTQFAEHVPKSLPLKLRTPPSSSMEEQNKAVFIDTRYGPHRSEIVLRAVKAEQPVEMVLASERKSLGPLVGADPRTLRHAPIDRLSLLFRGPVRAENVDTSDGRELAMAVGPIGPGELLVARALYPSARVSRPAWLAARFAFAELLKSLEPQKA